jgi:hypothetical protein
MKSLQTLVISLRLTSRGFPDHFHDFVVLPKGSSKRLKCSRGAIDGHVLARVPGRLCIHDFEKRENDTIIESSGLHLADEDLVTRDQPHQLRL